MERISSVVVGAALAAFAGAAQAAPKTAEAVLAAAPSGEVRQVIDGRVWKCLGTGCRGLSASAPKSRPPVFECQRVSAELGAVTAYRTGGRDLSAAQLAQCNTVAKAPAAVGLAAGR